ncbi:unnamed protein product [Caenorhabditis auriculariae]|uniref:Domain of unknown function DX domain-containing protein n=1 Tax=Caenorhabditis auriculariae TaxID=2777116 RepID=A0A8S1HNN3_9PELO|nr:unnamed protein product [Caenorhabditis auriculariae]
MKYVALWLMIATQIVVGGKDYSRGFQKWIGEADEEISAVEPSKECKTNADCGQNQYCEDVFTNNAYEEIRQRCFKVPTIFEKVTIREADKIGVKACSYTEYCDTPDVCYPLKHEVYDAETAKFLKGVCTKIPQATQDPEEVFGDGCETSEECTDDQFRPLQIFFVRDIQGICCKANFKCPGELNALPAQISATNEASCIEESVMQDTSEFGKVCCPMPYSYTLYWTTIETKKKLPRGYAETGAGSVCLDENTCNADEHCDESVNIFVGRGKKDNSAYEEEAIRFCYKVPIDDFTTYQENFKDVCRVDYLCDPPADYCHKLPLQSGAPEDIYKGFCAKRKNSTSTLAPEKEEPGISTRNDQDEESSAIDQESFTTPIKGSKSTSKDGDRTFDLVLSNPPPFHCSSLPLLRRSPAGNTTPRAHSRMNLRGEPSSCLPLYSYYLPFKRLEPSTTFVLPTTLPLFFESVKVPRDQLALEANIFVGKRLAAHTGQLQQHFISGKEREAKKLSRSSLLKIAARMAAVTQDQKEEFGDLCGNSQDCTADKFRSGKRGDAIAGCKKFNVTNGFLSHDAGICLRANVLCLSRMKATQPFYSANGTALCSKEVREFKNNDLGSICCPEPLSYSLYWTTVEYENKLPIDYEKDGVGKTCTDSRECRNEEFCDDAVNAFNGIGAKDKSGTNNQPLRYCYRS